MIFYDEYGDVPSEEIEALLRAQEMGRLVTVGADGTPHVGLYPFLHRDGAVELHLNRADEQLADLASRPRCVFEVDEVLGVIPSYWVDPEDAVKATAYHRTVIFECEARVSHAPGEIAAHQTALLARYQPEGGFRTVAAGDPLYERALSHIAALRLAILATRAKFKLGQNRTLEARERIVRELRRRGRPLDARAADALQWTIDRERGRPPSG